MSARGEFIEMSEFSPPPDIDLSLWLAGLKYYSLFRLFLDVFAVVCPTAGGEGVRVPEIVRTARELFA